MNWIIEENTEESIINLLSKELNVDPIISSMLVNRGIKSFEQAKDFFRPNLNQLHDPFLMKDMDIAVSRIVSAIENRQDFNIACLEEISFLNKWIGKKEVKDSIKFYGNCSYSNYLKKFIQ